jgi:hypothetical protein
MKGGEHEGWMFHVEHSARLRLFGCVPDGDLVFSQVLEQGLRQSYLSDSNWVASNFDDLSMVYFDDYLFDSKVQVV